MNRGLTAAAGGFDGAVVRPAIVSREVARVIGDLCCSRNRVNSVPTA